MNSNKRPGRRSKSLDAFYLFGAQPRRIRTRVRYRRPHGRGRPAPRRPKITRVVYASPLDGHAEAAP